MKIRALRFPADPPRAGPLPAEIGCASGRDLEQIKPTGEPAAYLVRSEDLERLRPFTDLIVDQGVRQGKGKELARYLLGLAADKIVLLDGNFQPPGSQVARSLRDLVQAARRKEESKLFVVGVETAIFERLWAQAETGRPATATSRPAAGRKPRKTPAASVAEALLGIRGSICSASCRGAIRSRTSSSITSAIRWRPSWCGN